MLRFLKTKNCAQQLDQITQCFDTALKHFFRADQFLSGSVLGKDFTRAQSAKGALLKGNMQFKEALCCYKRGIRGPRPCRSEEQRALKEVAGKFDPSIGAQFVSEDVRHQWIRDAEWLRAECKRISSSEAH